MIVSSSMYVSKISSQVLPGSSQCKEQFDPEFPFSCKFFRGGQHNTTEQILQTMYLQHVHMIYEINMDPYKQFPAIL